MIDFTQPHEFRLCIAYHLIELPDHCECDRDENDPIHDLTPTEGGNDAA